MHMTEHCCYMYRFVSTAVNCHVTPVMDLTCELVAMDSTHWPEVAFQNLTVLSAVPPPEARRLLYHGHHARACQTGGTEGTGIPLQRGDIGSGEWQSIQLIDGASLCVPDVHGSTQTNSQRVGSTPVKEIDVCIGGEGT